MECKMWPSKILMVRPNGFRVEYSINPHMMDKDGNLNKVDEAASHKQWAKLKQKLEELNQKVEVIEGDSRFPDMVFCANQTFPFISKEGKKSIILSRMKSDFRQGELPYFEEWAQKNNFHIHQITDFSFEGCGDAIWNYETQEVFAGFGFRTAEKVYEQIEAITYKKMITLELVSPQFYHLDTCFVVLNGQTAAYVEEAFSAEAILKIKSKFKHLIKIDLEEALRNFAGNAFCVDGKNVVLHIGAQKFTKALKENGFNVHEVDVSEFLKSGGAVFCMKQVLF